MKRDANTQKWLEETWEKVRIKMTAECGRLGETIPFAPKNGRYFDVENTPLGLGFWTNGFWPGMLWQMAHATGDDKLPVDRHSLRCNKTFCKPFLRPFA